MLKMYGVLCESDTGLDCFGNPTGEKILFERTGDMSLKGAEIQARNLKASGKYGDVKIVELVVQGIKIDNGVF